MLSFFSPPCKRSAVTLVYGRFTELFDMLDLKNAKVLLEELS
jgi:hypothetical protein